MLERLELLVVLRKVYRTKELLDRVTCLEKTVEAQVQVLLACSCLHLHQVNRGLQDTEQLKAGY